MNGWQTNDKTCDIRHVWRCPFADRGLCLLSAAPPRVDDGSAACQSAGRRQAGTPERETATPILWEHLEISSLAHWARMLFLVLVLNPADRPLSLALNRTIRR